ncbi:hypothetical protein V8E36_002901 [Tilletia maclaganii]
MSLADELSGALGGGRKRRGGGARRKQQYLSDDDEDDYQQGSISGGGAGGGDHLGGAIDGQDAAGDSLGAELADLAGSSRRSRRAAKSSSSEHPIDGDGLDDQLDDGDAHDPDNSLGGHAPKSRGPSGGATYVQQADPLSDPSAHPGSAESQMGLTTEQTCSALGDVLSSTEAFLARLRKITTTTDAATTSGGLPSSTTAANLSTAAGSSSTTSAAEDTARLESYAAALLRSLRETATQREQQVRDLREVDRHLARAEATDPDFLAKLGEADERLDAEADELEAGDVSGSTASFEEHGAAGTTLTWAEAQQQQQQQQRRRERRESMASTETERPVVQAVPRVQAEPFTSEVTDNLATLLRRSATDVDVEEGGDGHDDEPRVGSDDDDEDDDHDEYEAEADRTGELDDGVGEDELGPGWDDPTYRGSSRRGGRDRMGGAAAGGVGDVSLDSTSAAATSSSSTLPALRTSSTLLIHSLSSLHETAQVHRATISAAERRLRALRLLLDGWKEEIVAARRSRAWIARWEGREPEREDLLLDDGSGQVDEVLVASLVTVASSSTPSLESSAGAGAGRYTAGSGVSPGAYAQEQMVRFERLLGEAEERARTLLTPLPLPRVSAAAA